MIEIPAKMITVGLSGLPMTTELKRQLEYYRAWLKERTGQPFTVEDILIGCLQKEFQDDHDFQKFMKDNAHLKVPEIGPKPRRKKNSATDSTTGPVSS